MKKIALYAVLSFMLMLGNAMAIDAPFTTAQAAQVYHSDNAASQPALPPTTIADSNASSGASIINSAGVDTGVQGQVSQLTQATMAFEEDADHRIQNLNGSNHAMSMALQTIEQNITQLQKQVMQLTSDESMSKGHAQSTMQHSDLGFYLNLAAAALFLLLSGLMMGKLISRRSQQPILKNNSETPSEYDFMGTAEAIPAKLDLARSYIAMNDSLQARAALKMVIEKGNAEQRLIALSLIEKLNSENK